MSVPQGPDVRARPAWPAPPPSFLSQPRAYSALRHEFDAIVAEIKPRLQRCRSERPDGMFELTVLPHRVIVRVDDDAVSFSWVSGRIPTVAGGCLLVIAWTHVASNARGAAALRSATPADERTYIAEGASAGDWRWCADDRVGLAQSSAHLTADWLGRTSIAPSA